MLDLRSVVQDFDGVERRLARRGEAAVATLRPVRDLAARRRELNLSLEGLKKRQSEANARVGQLMRTDRAAGEAARAEARAIGDEARAAEEELRRVEGEIEKILLVVPNLPHDSVPDGKDETGNVVVRAWGEKPVLDFPARPHWELGRSSASWSGRRPPRSPARASPSRRAPGPGSSGRWPPSSSTCTSRAATARCCPPTSSPPRP